MTKKNIAILGGNGFLGNLISSYLGATPITRENYYKYKGQEFDTIIIDKKSNLIYIISGITLTPLILLHYYNNFKTKYKEYFLSN